MPPMDADLGAAEPHAEPNRRPLDAAPGLARIAAGAWLRTAGWTAGVAVRAGRRTVSAAVSGQNPLDLVREAQTGLIAGAQRLLGVSELEERLTGLLGGGSDGKHREPLRQRGYELLERSSELEEHGEEHPAYARILTELSPDEARILRLLAAEGRAGRGRRPHLATARHRRQRGRRRALEG